MAIKINPLHQPPTFKVESTSQLLVLVDVHLDVPHLPPNRKPVFPQALSSPDQCVCSLLQTGRLEGAQGVFSAIKRMKKVFQMMSKLDYYHLMQMREYIHIYIYISTEYVYII